MVYVTRCFSAIAVIVVCRSTVCDDDGQHSIDMDRLSYVAQVLKNFEETENQNAKI